MLRRRGFGVILGKNEKQTLERGEWLIDRHVTAAQMLLKKTIPNINGLQTPLLSQLIVGLY